MKNMPPGSFWVLKISCYKEKSATFAKWESLKETLLAPPRWNPPWRGKGLIELRGFHPSASTGGARRSDVATSDKDKQICFMLMLRTWFKVEEFRLE